MDLRSMTDDDLDALRRDVLTEQERRQRLAQLPDQLAAMARDAAEAGCNPDDLIERVTDALTPERAAHLEEVQDG